MLYATDASIYQVEPLGVVIPAGADDVQTVVEFCRDHVLPLLPRGGGTSLAGQCVNRALVLDLAPYMDRVLEIDPAARRARVEPGVVLDHLNAALAPHGLMFGPDVATAAQATIGGMIGNNSAGAYSLLYGRTVEHLRGLDVLLASGERLRLERGAAARDPHIAELTGALAEIVMPIAGEIDRRWPRTTRRVDGYNLDLLLEQLRRSTPGTHDQVNLAHLLCGSEGTLAVTLAAELDLVERPRARGLAIIAFAGVDAALRELPALLATGPAAIELIDDVILQLAAENPECRRGLDCLPGGPAARPGAVFYVARLGDDRAEIAAALVELEQRYGADRVRICLNERSMADAWQLRRSGEPLLHGLPGARKPVTFIEDLAVDPAVLADFVGEFREIVQRHGTRAAWYAHASVGCLHIRPLIDLSDAADRDTMKAIMAEATDLVRERGGALSGEHGDGRARSALLERFYGRPICDAFRAVKALFDPANLLNPGNIVDPQAPDVALRVMPHERVVDVPPVETFFRYQREHGFAEAVTRCNGAGVCRKRSGGTMCPSYRATRDERHATRGRGNALRLAITGQLGDGNGPAWNDAETLETLDLCLSCKACGSECPSNVDIARLKAEYLAQSFRAAGGAPLRTRAFGAVRALSRLASAAAPLSGALASWGPARALIDRAAGIDPRRSLPPIERSLYRQLGARARGQGADSSAAPAVVLLPDCFTVYSEPAIGRAAARVLEALGYRVILPRAGCCGRAMISTGLLEHATATIAATARELAGAIEAHGAIAIVGCEPSCVSAIIDDWPDLRLGTADGAARTVTAATEAIEEFIERRWETHPRHPGDRHPPGDRHSPEDRHPAGDRHSPGDRHSVGEAGSSPGGDGGRHPVLLHGHCHQRAVWGVERTASLLRRFVGDRVEVLDAGCCGMAGAFGYTRDHYDLSMQIAGLALLPALRAQPDATIVAPGTSCRHQIRDGAGRRARHPIEVVEGAICGRR